MSQPLHGRITEMDIFQKCDDFFTKVELFWTDCVGACTDGAAAMTGHTARFYARVQSASDTPITFTHSIIHREALVAKTMSSALNTRIFANLCCEMESKFTILLLHCFHSFTRMSSCLVCMSFVRLGHHDG